MNFLENIINAFIAINTNKLRSWLSMLWIIIWVSSVIIMISIGEWAQRRILSRIEWLGTNLITIFPWWQSKWDVRWSRWWKSSTDVLTTLDVDIIRKNVKHISWISPEFSWRKQVIYWSNNTSSSINGVAPGYEIVRNAKVEFGQFISEENLANMDKVAVLGPAVVTTLFEWQNPIGQNIKIENNIFTVIWVMEEKWQQWFSNADEKVFIPLTTAQVRIFWSLYLSYIWVSVDSAEYMEEVKNSIETTLMAEAGIEDIEEANFSILNQADAVSAISDVTKTLKIFLGWIAAISLIVWWIWVMNIMLVSVTERTREIWLRKAVWAQKGDIILQFLTESTILSVFGWVIGIIISYLIISAIQMSKVMEVAVSVNSIFMSFFFAAFIWIFFWLLPAYKAANLKPIDALRFE